MLCEKCKKNEATFYYHENVNGNEKTYHLCSECAGEMEKNGEISTTVDSFDSFFGADDPFKSMNNLLAGFFNPSIKQAQMAVAKKCPVCGMTFNEFSANGMAGCPTCYDTFAKELEPTISKIQGRSAHNGRVPAKFKAKADLRKNIEALEAEQKQAVADENYERAAEIRDELKKLRGQSADESAE